jgi:hypothetical protein
VQADLAHGGLNVRNPGPTPYRDAMTAAAPAGRADRHHVRARADAWAALTRDAAAAVAAAERDAGWVERAIAAPPDVEGALHRSLGRLTARLEEAR